ncbi:MAG: NADP-dependent oxidoreductase [Burkholderiales bacterium]
MNSLRNRQWRLARRPVGLAREMDFEWHEELVSAPGPGRVLVRNQYLSLEPTNRAWMWQEDTYLPAQHLGSVVRGFTVGIVEESNNTGFPEGSLVTGMLGWQDYSITDGKADFLMRLPANTDIPPAVHLGLLGHTGIAAYFGLIEVGRLKPGETLVVSSAAGAVGSLVGQIGKIRGAHVVGIASSSEKCQWLTKELGFDAAINYKSEPVFKRLRQHCPHGVDVYFDNVGGTILEDVLNILNAGARVVICGMLSLYNDSGGSLTFPAGPNNFLNLMLKRARVEGFVFLDYMDRSAEATDALVSWHNEGKIHCQPNVLGGLQNAPMALTRIFDGSNRGRLVVKIA